MDRKRFFSLVALLVILIPCIAVAGTVFAPPMPYRIGGTVTIDGIQITQDTDDGLIITVTKTDGSNYTNVNGNSSQDTDGLNGANWYLIDIPIYNADDQPGGATPDEAAVIHVFKNGVEYALTDPEIGRAHV